MKLTWFGGTTIRVHIGGAILVMDAAGAPEGIDRTELVSGADRVFESEGHLEPVDPQSWRPRKAGRLLDDDGGLPEVQVWAAGPGAVLVEAVGEPPLLLVTSALPVLGRWAGHAVVVLFGDGSAMSERGGALLAQASPLLVALAGAEADVDLAVAALRDQLDGSGLSSLEAGLALEI